MNEHDLINKTAWQSIAKKLGNLIEVNNLIIKSTNEDISENKFPNLLLKKKEYLSILYKENIELTKLRNVASNQLLSISRNEAAIKTKEEKIMPYDECLDKTFNEKIQFDQFHPYFGDDKFYNDLLKKYIKYENFEECEKIKKLKDMA